MTVFGVGQQARTEPDHERHTTAGGRLQGGDPVADPVLVQRQLGDADVAGRVAPLGGLGLAGQHVEQPVGRPRHGGHRRDAEALVDRRALGVVDAGHDALHAERLAGHPRRDDVGVVARRDRGERSCLLDACPQQHVAVEPHAEHALTRELGGEAVKCRAVAIDDGHVVTDPGQAVRQRRAHPAASHDHYTHLTVLSGMSVANPRTRNATAFRRPTAVGLTLGSRVQAFDRCAAVGSRKAVPQRQARAHAPTQADRAAGLRVRRAVFGGLRAGGNLSGALGRGPDRLLDGAVDRAGGRARSC